MYRHSLIPLALGMSVTHTHTSYSLLPNPLLHPPCYTHTHILHYSLLPHLLLHLPVTHTHLTLLILHSTHTSYTSSLLLLVYLSIQKGGAPGRVLRVSYIRFINLVNATPSVGVLPEQWYSTFGSTPRPVKN